MFLFPLEPNSKLPTAGVSWKTLLSERQADHEKWLRAGRNVGYPTGAPNGVCVVDFDDKEQARQFYRMNKTELKTMVETRKGVHFYYRTDGRNVRNSQKKDGYPYDVRGEGGYVVYPPSVIDGWTYKFAGEPVAMARLPLIRPELIPIAGERAKPIVDEHLRRVYRAKLWIQKVPGAISGQGGHNATFRVASQLVQRFGLSPAEAMPLLLQWNDTCKPPWSFNQLSKKLNDARQSGEMK
jgi:hypothetical protein